MMNTLGKRIMEPNMQGKLQGYYDKDDNQFCVSCNSPIEEDDDTVWQGECDGVGYFSVTLRCTGCRQHLTYNRPE